MSYMTIACALAGLVGFNLGYVVHSIVARRPQLPK